MASTKKLGGVQSISVTAADGTSTALSVKSCKVRVSDTKRESINDANGTPGFKESKEAGRIEADASVLRGTSLGDTARWDDVTVTVVCASGTIYSLNGWLTDAPDHDVAEGSATYTFEGDCTEILP